MDEERLRLKNEFTKPECDLFRALCNFTPDERRVFDMRVSDHSIVEISMALCMSEATVNRRIKSIKKKIYRVL
jgi:DNA-directed RNA polymerase specialized sigma24 family protein